MFKIVIDPGHGKNDNKGVYPEYKEGTQMWKLAQKILTILADYECSVICTRPSIDDNPTPEERGKMAAGADFFLSLHSNTPGSDEQGTPAYEKCTGTISFYSIKRPDDKAFAVDLAKKTAEIMGIYSRGAKQKTKKNGDDYYSVIRNSIEVGCKHSYIIEHGFHTNKHDCAFLLDDGNLQKIAEAEVALIEKYYGIKKKEPPIPSYVIEAGDIVSVIAGAVYWNGKSIPKSILQYNWKVTSINHLTGRAVLGKSEDGKHSLNSAVDSKYLVKVTAEEAPKPETFPAVSYTGTSIKAALQSIQVNDSFSYRSKIAKANGITAYLGTSKQNATLLNLLKQGELIKP